MTRPVAASAGTVTSWAASAAATVAVTLAAIRGERALTVRSMRDWLAARSAVSVGYCGEQVPDAGLVQPVADGPFQGRGDAGQGVAQPVGQPGLVGGQVDVEAVEDPQLAEQLVGAGVEPVDLLAPGAGGIGEHVGVAAVGLGLARVQVGGAAHHQARHIGHRRAPPGGDRQGELGDRAGLVDHQPRRAVPGGPVQQRLQVGLVVGDGPGEQPLAVVVEDLGEVLVLADVQPDPHIHLLRCGHRRPFLHSSAWSAAREGRPWCARRHPPYESAIKPHVPIRGSRTDRAGGNTPQAIPAAGGNEPYRHRRTSQARTVVARAHVKKVRGLCSPVITKAGMVTVASSAAQPARARPL